MRFTELQIRDVRSIWGPAQDISLGERVTVLVGANRAGTSNVAFALAAALDERVVFAPGRDLPHRGSGDPRVLLRGERTPPVEVGWDPVSGARHVRSSDGEVAGATGHVVYAQIHHTPRDLVRALPDGPRGEAGSLEATIRDTARHVVPDVAAVTIDAQLKVVITDLLGAALPVPLCRAVVALGLARHLTTLGTPPAATVVESPDAFLHPAAQEDMAALLVEVAADTDRPVLVTATSPFVVPRVEQAMIVSLARDADGRTGVVAAARGDAAQARQLGGLLRDAGLAAVLDRLGRITSSTRGVLIVEGGTDVAYLELAARMLGREEVLQDVVIQEAGGAMGAALAAIVLRAELEVRLVVLLDHDDPGRRARDTLTSRFDFDRRRQIVTYADVFDGAPPGIEAESLFDIDLVRRFVREQGPSSSRGEVDLHGVPHVDLTSAGKSAFVGWLRTHARVEQIDRWNELLDLLQARLGGRVTGSSGMRRAPP